MDDQGQLFEISFSTVPLFRKCLLGHYLSFVVNMGSSTSLCLCNILLHSAPISRNILFGYVLLRLDQLWVYEAIPVHGLFEDNFFIDERPSAIDSIFSPHMKEFVRCCLSFSCLNSVFSLINALLCREIVMCLCSFRRKGQCSRSIDTVFFHLPRLLECLAILRLILIDSASGTRFLHETGASCFATDVFKGSLSMWTYCLTGQSSGVLWPFQSCSSFYSRRKYFIILSASCCIVLIQCRSLALDVCRYMVTVASAGKSVGLFKAIGFGDGVEKQVGMELNSSISAPERYKRKNDCMNLS